MVVEIVITQDEWDDLVSTMWGDVEAAAEHVRDLMLNQPRDQRYLVYSQCNVMPGDSPAPGP